LLSQKVLRNQPVRTNHGRGHKKKADEQLNLK
jgi:hypothetical protein